MFKPVHGIAVAVVLALAAPAFAGSVSIGKNKFDTLQDAFDKVKSGQRIVLRGDIAWRGQLDRDVRRVTIDARRANVRGHIVAHADKLKIRGGRFEYARLTIFGDRAKISKATFFTAGVPPLHIEGADARIERCTFLDGPGPTVNGDRARLRRSQFVGCETLGHGYRVDDRSH